MKLGEGVERNREREKALLYILLLEMISSSDEVSLKNIFISYNVIIPPFVE